VNRAGDTSEEAPGPESDAAVTAVEDADAGMPDIPVAPQAATGAGSARRESARRVLRIAAPLLIGAGALFVAFSAAGGVAQSLRLLRKVDRTYVLAAVGAELACYVALSLHLRYLGGPQANVRRLAPFRLALVVFGLGTVLPAAPAEGLVMAGSALHHRRLAKRRAVVVLGLAQWFSSASLYAVAAVSALVVVGLSRVPLPDRSALVIVSIGSLVVLAFVGWLCSRRTFAEWVAVSADRIRFWRPSAPRDDSRARGGARHDAVMHVVSGPRGVLYLSATAALAWVADAGCLHLALLAFGARVSPAVLLFAYTAGTLASMVPLLPAGLGVVETVTPAVLGLAGVSLATALAAVVVYRAVGTLLPAVAGGAVLLAMHIEEPADGDEQTGDGADAAVAHRAAIA